MKNKFIKSTLILIIGGLITKILGMIIKIVMTRLLGTQGIGTYSLITPSFMLLISVAQLGLPIAISKLVAEDTRNNKNLVFISFPITIIVNIIILIFLLFFSDYIATNLLHEKKLYYGLISIGLVLPFISISSILRGYFFGKQKMFPHIISNITEDFIRLIIIIIGIPIFIKKGIEYAIAFIILSNIISELTSILILFFFIPKKFKITKKDLEFNKNNVKEILGISLPTTGSRLIGTLGFFLEPIIITEYLFKYYSQAHVITEYGIISGYVMPLILLPSFFTLAISQALIPVISNNYIKNNKEYIIKKIKQAICISLLIGIPATIIFTVYPHIPLKLIYNTSEGINYIKVLAPICLLHYIQSPISSTLQAMGKAKDAMIGTLIGTIIRTVLLIITCNLKIGLWALVIATSSNIIFVTIFDTLKVKKHIKKMKSIKII